MCKHESCWLGKVFFFYFENSVQGVQETNLKYGRHPHYQQPPKQQSQASCVCDAQDAKKKKIKHMVF